MWTKAKSVRKSRRAKTMYEYERSRCEVQDDEVLSVVREVHKTQVGDLGLRQSRLEHDEVEWRAQQRTVTSCELPGGLLSTFSRSACRCGRDIARRKSVYVMPPRDFIREGRRP